MIRLRILLKREKKIAGHAQFPVPKSRGDRFDRKKETKNERKTQTEKQTNKQRMKETYKQRKKSGKKRRNEMTK